MKHRKSENRRSVFAGWHSPESRYGLAAGGILLLLLVCAGTCFFHEKIESGEKEAELLSASDRQEEPETEDGGKKPVESVEGSAPETVTDAERESETETGSRTEQGTDTDGLPEGGDGEEPSPSAVSGLSDEDELAPPAFSGSPDEDELSPLISDDLYDEKEAADFMAAAEPEAESEEAFHEQMAVFDPLPAGTVLSLERQGTNDLSGYFTIDRIVAGDAVYQRINGKSWQENPFVPLDDLRYLKLLHYNFDDQIQVGELIVNKSIAEDVSSIFQELFAAGYQIQSMYLIDQYWTGDPEDSDTASVDANNSSAFCYRPATDGTKLSKHAYGRAIDINPQQNPYVSYASGSPRWYHENADAYIRRDVGLPHMITHEDTAFLIFSKYGFFWGGDWNIQKDYQHFQKE